MLNWLDSTVSWYLPAGRPGITATPVHGREISSLSVGFQVPDGDSRPGDHASGRIRNRNVQGGQLLCGKLESKELDGKEKEEDRPKKSWDCAKRAILLRSVTFPVNSPMVAGRDDSRTRLKCPHSAHLSAITKGQQYYKHTRHWGQAGGDNPRQVRLSRLSDRRMSHPKVMNEQFHGSRTGKSCLLRWSGKRTCRRLRELRHIWRLVVVVVRYL